MRQPSEPAIDLAPRGPALERQFSGRIEATGEPSFFALTVVVGIPLGVALLMGAGFLFDVVRGALVWWEWVRP